MREDHEAVEGNLNYMEEDNALIVKKNRRSKYNNTHVSQPTNLQKIGL